MDTETRTHKLIVFAGDQDVSLEGRDFKKLSQVIVNEYLSQSNAGYRTYLTEILTKAIRAIPLKCHLYAGLTVSVAKNYPDLASKILQNVLLSLQNDLASGSYSEVLNTLNYISECMNISYVNSLNYMNLLEDLQQAAQKEEDLLAKKALLTTIVRAMPLFGYSLHQKTTHEFKKFLEKLSKQVEGDQLFTYLYGQFQRGNSINYSAMGRLQCDFGQIDQHNGKLRLTIELKPPKNKDGLNNEIYKWETHTQEQVYEQYRKGQGLIVRMWLQQLINTFSTTSGTLLSKFLNLIKFTTKTSHQIRFLVESLLLRGLRNKGSMAQHFLLLALRNSDDLPEHSKAVQEVLIEFFSLAESFQLSILVSFSKIFAFVSNNSRQKLDLSQLIENQQMFLKRSALLRLIIQKMTLLNDKFSCPPALKAYESIKPINEEQFKDSADVETFQTFEEALGKKTNAEMISTMIKSERDYEIFLEALFRRTCLSHTHLTILSERYSLILSKFGEWDWDLINRVRNFFRNSFFHRLLYFRFLISKKYLSFASYVNYVGGLTGKSDLEMLWIKIELNELNNEFGKSLKK